MLDLEHDLNDEQRAVALNGDGACLVLAGAGSGKTRTITYRVAHLLAQGIAPDRILLVTFTNKAAQEMTARVQALTGQSHPLAWSGTFHHIAFRILKQYAPLVGYKNNFTILDSDDSTSLLKLCLKQAGIGRQERRFPSASVTHSIISYAFNAQCTIAEVLERKHPQWLEIAATLSQIAQAYGTRKLEANAMDFDDLLYNLERLFLQSESVRQKFSGQFLYILVDEYQDTNNIQASIIKLLAIQHGNVLVVGDDAQSIYSFRAADIEHILHFEKDYPQAKIFRLETNYRSTPEILQVANEVIANNINQYKKKLQSVREKFVRPAVHEFADSAEEADFIADRILELRAEGVPLSSIAVLFRAAFHSQALELELTKRDIPYDYRGGVRFFERAHVKDVLAYLRARENGDDTVAWSRLLNMQIGIGPTGAGRIIASLRAVERHDLESLKQLGYDLSTRGQTGWNDLMQIWECMEQVEPQTPAELIKAIVNSKYAEYLENEYPDYRERRQDLGQLARFAERQPDVHQFLAEATLQESFSARSAVRSGEETEKLVLSTVHQAKGLEWDTVFVINVSAGQFPNERSLHDPASLEEERRLFYVAVTRAKQQLYFTYPLVGNFDAMITGPSIFLEEINAELLDINCVPDSTVIDSSTDADDELVYEKDKESSLSKKSFLRDISDL